MPSYEITTDGYVLVFVGFAPDIRGLKTVTYSRKLPGPQNPVKNDEDRETRLVFVHRCVDYVGNFSDADSNKTA